MNETLNPAIAAYVNASNAREVEALRRCFSPNAVVRDEGQTYEGSDGVSRWIDHTLAANVFTIEPLSFVTQENETVVTCRLAGTFPGSPIELRFLFRLGEDGIALLEIAP